MTERIKCFVKGAAMMLAGPVPSRGRRYHYATDADALASDWKAVGADMQQAMDTFSEEQRVKEYAPAK